MALSIQVEQGNSYTCSPAHEPEDLCLSDESFPDISRTFREELVASLEHTAALATELDESYAGITTDDDVARDMLGNEIDLSAVDEMIRATIIPFNYEPDLMVLNVCGAAVVVQSPFMRASATEVLQPNKNAPVVGIEHLVASTPTSPTSPEEAESIGASSSNGQAAETGPAVLRG